MLKLVRKIWAVLTPGERRRMILLTVVDAISSVTDIAGLAMLLWVVRLYAEGHVAARMHDAVHGRGAGILPGWLTDPGSLWPIVVLFLLFGLKNWLSFLIYSAQARLRYSVASRISRENLLHYLEGDYQQYAHTDSASHVLKIAQQPIEFCQFVLGGLQQSITEATLIGVTVAAVLWFNAKLFLLLLVLLVPPVVFVGWLAKRKLHAARLYIKSSRDVMWQHLQESIAGYIESGLYEKKDFFGGRYGEAQTILNRHLATVQGMQGAPSRLAETFAVFGLVTLIAIGHFAGNPQSAAFVTLGAFLAAAYKIIPGISRLLNMAGQMKTYEFTVNGLLERHSRPAAEPDYIEAIHSVSGEGLTARYGDTTILTGISLKVRRGDFLGIQGDSGRGKTTLLNILLGFVAEEAGEVKFNGEVAIQAERRSYWSRIAYVKQQPFLLHDSVLVNITLQDQGFDAERLRHAVTFAGLDDLIRKLPGGLQTKVTENGKNISGGQRQRIAIARALYKQADLILLDEPFSELDEAAEEALLRQFAELAELGKLVILITHNKQSLNWCTHRLSLDALEFARRPAAGNP